MTKKNGGEFRVAKTVIVQPQDDGTANFILAIVLLVIFVLVVWYWGIPAIKNTTIVIPSDAIKVNVQQVAPSAPPSNTQTY